MLSTREPLRCAYTRAWNAHACVHGRRTAAGAESLAALHVGDRKLRAAHRPAFAVNKREGEVS